MCSTPSPAETGPSPVTGRLPYVVAALLVLCTVAIFLQSTHKRTGTWLAAPLDDTFIHFQYAKQLSRGRVLQFNDGDSPTTGATSLLYLLVLAPGWALGLRGLNMLIWAWIINGVFHLTGGAAVFSCINRITRNRPLAYTGMAAFLINGHMLWGAYSQMEIALFSMLALLTLDAAIRLEQGAAAAQKPPSRSGSRLKNLLRVLASALRAPRSVLLWGSLLALVRPEGTLLAGGLFLWLLWRHLGQAGETRLRARLWQARRLVWPVATGAGMVLLFILLTGRLGTNANLKSHLVLLPHDLDRYLETSLGWLPMTIQILMDKWPRALSPLITVLLLVGLGGWAAAGKLRRPGAGALVLIWLALLTLFYAFMFARRDHFDRYYLPYFGVTVVVIWWTLGQLGQRLPKLRGGPVVIGALMLLMMIPHTRFWARRFGDNCRDLVQQHFVVARWVKKNTPAGSRIMVNDAGAIPFLSQRYTYDVVGLASNAFYKLKKVIPFSDAPAWEALEALRARPRYTVAYPEWIPQMHRFRVFETLKSFPVRNRTMVANELKVVWKMRWDLLADSSRPPAGAAPGKKLVDRLDVAFIRSEHQHDYRRLDRDTPRGMLIQQLHGHKALIDGGRQLSKGESFVLTARPKRAATLLLRTRGHGQLDLSLSLNGGPAMRWQPKLGGGDFAVVALPIPAARITSERLRLQIKAHRPYSSFHYWLMQ